MFIEQGIKPENKFWKYLLGSLVVFIASQIGSLPLIIAVFIKSFKTGDKIPTTNDELINYLEPNLSLFLTLLIFVVALISLFIIVKKFHKQTILSVTTSRKKVDWNRILFSFGLWVSITIAITIYSYYCGNGELILDFNPGKFAILAVIAIVLLPIQTSTEEYIFRGYLMQGFGNGSLNKKFTMGILYSFLFLPLFFILKSFAKSILYSDFFSLFIFRLMPFALAITLILLLDFQLTKFNFFESKFYLKLYTIGKKKIFPLLITSLIFGTMHILNPEVSKLGYIILVYYIGTGLFLGIITLMDEGMELALGFHAANNLIGALLVSTDWTVLKTYAIFKDTSEPTAGFETIFLPVFIMFPLLLFIFSKKYKWIDWKDKLTGNINFEINKTI